MLLASTRGKRDVTAVWDVAWPRMMCFVGLASSARTWRRRLPPPARRVLRRFRRRVVPPPSTWHYTLPGYDRWLELRWAVRIRRAPVMSPEQHAAAVADPRRRHAAIEVPIGCAVCDGRRLQALFHAHDRRHPEPRWDYHVVRCAECGFLYRHPGIRPERLGDLYAGGNYAKFLGGQYSRQRVRRYEVTMAGFGALFASGAGRRLLDFGCGNGLFLDVAYDRGFECYGVDLAPDAIEAARMKPSGSNAYFGAPAEVPEIAAGGFQVITLWSVLAHLARPVEDLTMLRSLLAPDGVLLILTVNAESLPLKRQLDAWGGFTPNHLLFSSPQTQPLLLGRAGFGAVVMPPWYGEPIERGTSPLSPRAQRRLRRTIDRGNRGGMLRSAAFVDPDGPQRWGLTEHARPLTSPARPAIAEPTVR
jgi:SAM-dependent methyltransferase